MASSAKVMGLEINEEMGLNGNGLHSAYSMSEIPILIPCRNHQGLQDVQTDLAIFQSMHGAIAVCEPSVEFQLRNNQFFRRKNKKICERLCCVFNIAVSRYLYLVYH
jgi:hypothetical protein